MGGPTAAKLLAHLETPGAAAKDPGKIWWDMCLVLPSKAKPVSSQAAEGREEGVELFDAAHLARRLAGAGLKFQCYRSIQGDEVYVRVGATMKRLNDQADVMDFKVKLDAAKTEAMAAAGFPDLKINPIEIPNAMPDGAPISRYAPFEHIYGKYEPEAPLVDLYETDEKGRHFTSSQRLKLLYFALSNARDFGGAEINPEKKIRQGKLLAALAAHDPDERAALYDGFVRAPLCTAPTRMPIDLFKDYFGEKQGLACALVAHLATSYALLMGLGVAVTVHQLATKNVVPRSVAAYAFASIIWGVCVTELWKRKEKRLALEWGTVGFEAEESVRPQFKGVKMGDPATGRPGLFFPRSQRQARIGVGAAVSALCIVVDLAFISGCIVLKKSDDPQTSNAGTFLQGLGIPVFSLLYTMVAVRLTDGENWPTNTIHQDKLVQKLTIFNLINAYTALFYAIFIPDRWWVLRGTCNFEGRGLGSQSGTPREAACFADLRWNLVVTFSIAVFTNNVLQSVVGYVKYCANYARESRGVGGKLLALSRKFSVFELQYLLAEYDETLDNIVAYQFQAVQYGYIALFGAAFPAAPVLAFLNNSLLLRMDCRKLLTYYRRVQPEAAEDIGVYQTILEGLNKAGAVSSAAIIVFQTPIFGGSAHHKDVCFIIIVAAVFAAIVLVQMLTDDVHPDVLLQIQRSEFIQAKIIDKIADEDDTLEFTATPSAGNVAVADEDAIDPYYTSVTDYFYASSA